MQPGRKWLRLALSLFVNHSSIAVASMSVASTLRGGQFPAVHRVMPTPPPPDPEARPSPQKEAPSLSAFAPLPSLASAGLSVSVDRGEGAGDGGGDGPPCLTLCSVSGQDDAHGPNTASVSFSRELSLR